LACFAAQQQGLLQALQHPTPNLDPQHTFGSIYPSSTAGPCPAKGRMML
jgi:hypothetical protein